MWKMLFRMKMSDVLRCRKQKMFQLMFLRLHTSDLQHVPDRPGRKGLIPGTRTSSTGTIRT